MESRRTFLKKSGGLAALLSIGSLSGCMGGSGILGGDGGDGGGSGTSYRNWLYDPAVVMDAKNRMFLTYNIESLYENKEALPAEFFTQMEQANSETDAVDVKELEHLSGQFYANLQGAMSGGQTPGGGSFVVSGSFDSGKLETSIKEDSDPETEYTSKGSYSGYTLYEMKDVQSDGGMGAGTQQEASGGLGFNDEDIVVGVTTGTDAATGIDAAKASIDASKGKVKRYHKASDNAKTLMDMLGDPTFATGAELDPSLMELATMAVEDQRAREMIDGLIGGGFGGTIQGETTEGKMIALYEEEDQPPADTAKALLDVAKSAEPKAFEEINDISVEKDGRALVMTMTMDTKALWEDYGEGTMSGSGGGSSSARLRDGLPYAISQLP